MRLGRGVDEVGEPPSQRLVLAAAASAVLLGLATDPPFVRVFFFSCPAPAAAVGSASGVLAAATTMALARRWLRGWCRWRGVRGREAVAAAMGNVRVSVCGRGVLSEAAEAVLRQRCSCMRVARGGRKAMRWAPSHTGYVVYDY